MNSELNAIARNHFPSTEPVRRISCTELQLMDKVILESVWNPLDARSEHRMVD